VNIPSNTGTAGVLTSDIKLPFGNDLNEVVETKFKVRVTGQP
jgi:hypothetical protein